MPDSTTSTLREVELSTAAAAHAKAIELGKHVLRMTSAAGSGHPSSGLALGHIVTELMYNRMRYDLANPFNKANDRLVLSIGHAVPIVYAAYADLGGAVGKHPGDTRPLTVDDLITLRELDSVLDGHPNPAEGFPFFDAATGSLGQGLSVAAGLGAAAKLDGIDKRIYVIVGDGEAREGQVWEAADFIVDHKLTNVTVIFSCNGHGQASPVSPQQNAEAIAAKMAAFGWQVIEVDGHDPVEISAAMDQINAARKPVAIVARTNKGWGVDLMQGKNFHGKPLSDDDLKQALGELDATGVRLHAKAGESSTPSAPKSKRRNPADQTIVLPPMERSLNRVGHADVVASKKLSTRVAYGVALAALGDVDKRVVVLDADVSNSTFSNMFARDHGERFLECKIAEQNMISVGAGLSAAGKIPFASTFAKFLARAVDQIDMAVISRANLNVVGSHAGVSLGADGPSQMSVTDIPYFRSMTKTLDEHGVAVCHVFHPSDAVSAYRCTELMANAPGLCYLRTHRPTAPFLYPVDEVFELCGCKQLRTGDALTLVSSGYMVHTALAAADLLARRGISVHVFDAYTFPMDASPILAAAAAAGRTILTVEDNYIGGLHGELAEQASAMKDGPRVVGMTATRIPKSAKTAAEVFDYVGVGLDQIAERAVALVGG